MDSVLFLGNGEKIEEHDCVEFRLLFEGRLPSSGSALDKHAIRKSFHPQLRRLWHVNGNLRQLASHEWKPPMPKLNDENLASLPSFPTEEERLELGLAAIGKNWNRAGYNLVPLVTPEMALRCCLDIVILRPENERGILKNGDIDNKLKTLFDALRIPESAAETGNAVPEPDDDPLFVLLQDDGLISEVKVSTDQLLMLPNQRQVRSDDAHVIIHVRLNHRNARTFGNYFG